MFSPRTGSVHENQSHDASLHSKPDPKNVYDFPPSSFAEFSDSIRRMVSVREKKTKGSS